MHAASFLAWGDYSSRQKPFGSNQSPGWRAKSVSAATASFNAVVSSFRIGTTWMRQVVDSGSDRIRNGAAGPLKLCRKVMRSWRSADTGEREVSNVQGHIHSTVSFIGVRNRTTGQISREKFCVSAPNISEKPMSSKSKSFHCISATVLI